MAMRSVQMSRLRKVLIGLGLAALLTLISFFPPLPVLFDDLEQRGLDYLFLLRQPRTGEALPLLMVLIDDAAVQPYGFRSPTPRALIGKVVEQLNAKGARCIGLDFLFDMPNVAAQDEALQRALARSEAPVVVVAPTLEPFARHVVLAFSEVKSDGRSIARTMTLRKPGEPVELSFVMALLQSCFGQKPDPRLPGDGNSLLINYFGPPTHLADETPTFPVISAASLDFLPPAAVQGKIVLVGSGMDDLGDIFLTSFSTGRSGFKTAYGVELHVTVLGNIFQNDFLERVPAGTLAGALFLYLALVGLGTLTLRTAPGLGIGLLSTGGWFGFAAAAFITANLVVPMVLPVFLAVLLFVGSQMILYLTESRYSSFLRSTFSRYIAPEVVRELIANPSELELGGKSKVVTVLFTDLEGFTTISEKLTPQKVVSLLNDHLGAMADILMEEKGTVGAFIGDAVMAFFGAPAELPEHAARTCRAALRMQQAMEGLNAQWKAGGLPQVKMRVGIHTGEVVIGNIGSERRQDFTIIGDTVNLSSRLEGVNKVFGTAIIASGATLASADGQFHHRELGRIVVKGKTEPVPIYELLAEKKAGGDGPIVRQKRYGLYLQGLEQYYAGKIAAAEKIFRQGAEQWHDPPAVFMAEQCGNMKGRKLPQDWHGEVEMTGK